MGPTKPERETTIRWDEDERVVRLFSASAPVWRKLARLGIPVVRESRRDGEVVGRFYEIRLVQFRWGLKRRGAKGNGEALGQARAERALAGVTAEVPHP